jgi:uncharacterized membrane protein
VNTRHPPQEPRQTLDVQAVLALRARQEGQVGRHQRLVERTTSALGRPVTIYLIVAVAALWAGANLAAPALGMAAIDPPPFSLMQGVIAFVALLMTTVVLTTQNRQVRHAEQRSHLDLQVNLLAEQKIAKLIALVEELRRDLPNVHNRKDSIAEAMTNAIDPGAVISVLEDDLGKPPATTARTDRGETPKTR